jgi:hypothetical protein
LHAEQGAQLVLLHHLAGPLGPVFAQAVPIDPLLPIQPGDAEIRSHDGLPLPFCTRSTSVRKNLTVQGGAAALRRNFRNGFFRNDLLSRHLSQA